MLYYKEWIPQWLLNIRVCNDKVKLLISKQTILSTIFIQYGRPGSMRMLQLFLLYFYY
jgi:hypothetical protein